MRIKSASNAHQMRIKCASDAHPTHQSLMGLKFDGSKNFKNFFPKKKVQGTHCQNLFSSKHIQAMSTMSTRARSALLAHNNCGEDCKPCTDCAYKQQVAIDEAKMCRQMMKDQAEAHKEFRAQDTLQMLQMRQRLEEAYCEVDAQRVQKHLATDQAAKLLEEKNQLEVELAMAEGRLEGMLETIADLKESLDEARRETMPVLEPRTPHKKRRTIRPTPVTTPAPEPRTPALPEEDSDCPICVEDTETEEEGSVNKPIKV
jgi:hypothetical protein